MINNMRTYIHDWSIYSLRACASRGPHRSLKVHKRTKAKKKKMRRRHH